jgi:tetratricopeptide (TPR) repeat protein
MRVRFGTVLAIVCSVGSGIAGSPAWAQVDPSPPGSGERQMVEPPKDLPKPQRGDPVRNLDFLFEALKIAPDEASAKHIEDRIWALWIGSQSDTANLLMTRVKTAVEAEDLDLAVRLLDSIVEIKPDYAEAWNRRATIYFQKKDYGRALADLRQVLAREPRHFGALSGLGIIMQEFGEEKLALEAFRRALAVNPHLQRIPDFVKTLTEKVEGRDL